MPIIIIIIIIIIIPLIVQIPGVKTKKSKNKRGMARGPNCRAERMSPDIDRQ